MSKLMMIFAFAAWLCCACGNKNPNATYTEQAGSSAEAAVIKFKSDSYDFGTIKQGDSVVHVYAFTNTGKSPLIITSAQSSCGCTVPQFPKEPIPPGKGGELKVVFNSAGKEGKIEKTVTINSNAAQAFTYVYLSGQVETAAKK